MDERKQEILRAVVHTYVRTAEPVASDQVMELTRLGVKAATIRNEMAEMADLGYLTQPHTSAGRIPSDLGYRYYVDRLMNPASAPRALVQQAGQISTRMHSAVDDLLASTCHLLSAITRLTAVATGPSAESVTLQWVDLKIVATGKVMLISLWSNGQLRHAIVEAAGISTDSLVNCRNRLSEMLAGKDRRSIMEVEAAEPLLSSAEESKLLREAKNLLGIIAREVMAREVFVDGTSFFARQPEFNDKSTMELVLSVLEEHQAMADLLDAAAVGNSPQVVIGGENPLEPLRSCSVVAASYGAENSARGSIGVCGPTRMDYQQAVASVGFVARSLSHALTALLPS